MRRRDQMKVSELITKENWRTIDDLIELGGLFISNIIIIGFINNNIIIIILNEQYYCIHLSERSFQLSSIEQVDQSEAPL